MRALLLLRQAVGAGVVDDKDREGGGGIDHGRSRDGNNNRSLWRANDVPCTVPSTLYVVTC